MDPTRMDEIEFFKYMLDDFEENTILSTPAEFMQPVIHGALR